MTISTSIIIYSFLKSNLWFNFIFNKNRNYFLNKPWFRIFVHFTNSTPVMRFHNKTHFYIFQISRFCKNLKCKWKNIKQYFLEYHPIDKVFSTLNPVSDFKRFCLWSCALVTISFFLHWMNISRQTKFTQDNPLGALNKCLVQPVSQNSIFFLSCLC